MEPAINIETFAKLLKTRILLLGKGAYDKQGNFIEDCKITCRFPNGANVELLAKKGEQTGVMFFGSGGQITSDNSLLDPDHFSALLYSSDLQLFDPHRKNTGAPPGEIGVLTNAAILSEDPNVEEALEELWAKSGDQFSFDSLESWHPSLTARGFLHLCSVSADPAVESAAKRLLLVLQWGERFSHFRTRGLEDQTFEFVQTLASKEGEWTPKARF